jgi:hypothetical protein
MGASPGGTGASQTKSSAAHTTLLVGFDQHLGACHGLAEETLVQQPKFVPMNATAQCEHEFEYIMTSHEMNVFVNAM